MDQALRQVAVSEPLMGEIISRGKLGFLQVEKDFVSDIGSRTTQ